MVSQKLKKFADLGGQADMKRFFQCLDDYRMACHQFQAQTSTELRVFASSPSYHRLFESLRISLLNLRSRFGIFSELYGLGNTLVEDKIQQYLNSTLPSALLSARGDDVEFVKLWQKVHTHRQYYYYVCLHM